MYNLEQIMSQGTMRAGRRDDLDASVVSLLANEAYFEVAGVYPRHLSEKTAYLSVESGTREVALPADIDDVLVLSYLSGSHGTLARMSLEELDSASTSPGTPHKFAFFANSIELYPSPNSYFSLRLRYREQPEALIDGTDVPSMSTFWRPAIVMKLEEKLHAISGNVPAAALAQQRYLSFISALRNDEARRQTSEHRMGARVIY